MTIQKKKKFKSKSGTINWTSFFKILNSLVVYKNNNYLICSFKFKIKINSYAYELFFFLTHKCKKLKKKTKTFIQCFD